MPTRLASARSPQKATNLVLRLVEQKKQRVIVQGLTPSRARFMEAACRLGWDGMGFCMRISISSALISLQPPLHCTALHQQPASMLVVALHLASRLASVAQFGVTLAYIVFTEIISSQKEVIHRSIGPFLTCAAESSEIKFIDRPHIELVCTCESAGQAPVQYST
jgi:hypothetical protein